MRLITINRLTALIYLLMSDLIGSLLSEKKRFLGPGMDQIQISDVFILFYFFGMCVRVFVFTAITLSH